MKTIFLEGRHGRRARSFVRVFIIVGMSTTHVRNALYGGTVYHRSQVSSGVDRALRNAKIVDTFQKSRRSRKIPIALRAVLP